MVYFSVHLKQVFSGEELSAFRYALFISLTHLEQIPANVHRQISILLIKLTQLKIVK